MKHNNYKVLNLTAVGAAASAGRVTEAADCILYIVTVATLFAAAAESTDTNKVREMADTTALGAAKRFSGFITGSGFMTVDSLIISSNGIHTKNVVGEC